MALYRYTRKTVRGQEVIDCGHDGRWPVTGDFDAIVCELLLNDAPDICEILDGVAQGRGDELTKQECQQARNFRTAIVKIIERHNERIKNDNVED